MFAIASTAMALTIGAKAPGFSCTSTKGVTSLSDFEGKKVILWFYGRAMTGGLTKEGVAFQANLPKFEAANCAVVG